jgi:mRNA-degrading endonuclease RelE of RelBE toxin-antitoxin system
MAMCFNVVVVNPRSRDLSFLKEVLNAEARTNNDGFSLYALDPDVYVRTLKKEEFDEAFERAKNAKLLHIHFRLGTTGSEILENVHMWDVHGYKISHNGTVGSYSNYLGRYYYPYGEYSTGILVNRNNKEKEDNVKSMYSDTRQLIEENEFKENVKERRWGKLASFIVSKGFYGVMFLTSKDEVIGISKDKSIHVYLLMRDVLVFCNTDIARGLSEVKKRKYGITFYVPPLKNVYINKYFVFSLKKMRIVLMRNMPEERIYVSRTTAKKENNSKIEEKIKEALKENGWKFNSLQFENNERIYRYEKDNYVLSVEIDDRGEIFAILWDNSGYFDTFWDAEEILQVIRDVNNKKKMRISNWIDDYDW